MKTIKHAVTVAAIAAAVLGAAFAKAPAFRAAVDQQIAQWTEWTPEARREAPVEFADHAARQLAEDIDAMRKTRAELGGKLHDLGEKIEEHRAQLASAEIIAEELRNAYQRHEFPVIFRGQAYEPEQVTRQVSMLLAEAEGYRANIERLEEVRQQAEEERQNLTVRINRNEAQIVALATQRPLLEAHGLEEQDEQLAAQVDELLVGNRETLAIYAVRPLEQLIEAAEPQYKPRPSLAAARDFLASGRKYTVAKPVSEIERIASEESVCNEDEAAVAKPIQVQSRPRRAKIRGKLVFE